jgi:Domain found in IF2B/IF5
MMNIGGDQHDTSYRYKMPRMVTKVEGRGNGIKTVIVNMVDIAKALHVDPAYPTKVCIVCVCVYVALHTLYSLLLNCVLIFPPPSLPLSPSPLLTPSLLLPLSLSLPLPIPSSLELNSVLSPSSNARQNVPL